VLCGVVMLGIGCGVFVGFLVVVVGKMGMGEVYGK